MEKLKNLIALIVVPSFIVLMAAAYYGLKFLGLFSQSIKNKFNSLYN